MGEALPGRPYLGVVQPGQAVRIMTGAPLPAGADAILPAEYADEAPLPGGPGVRITEAVPPGRNVGCRGEDIEAGSVVLRAGRGALRLREDGDVELVGSRISTMSRGLFRIVGRVLRLN